MIFSAQSLQQYLPALSEISLETTWWVALSGGLDSCVLLHALASLDVPVKLRALHVNHQISVNADSWQQHCVDICNLLNVPLVAEKVQVINTGCGLEDAARELRYAIFEQYLNVGDVLFTAHHADDQSETLLLRLMRGTGPRGLAAMARSRPLSQGLLYRPLLDFTREHLAAYAELNHLRWVDDESNANDHYDRNFLRNQVIPLLRERWPSFTQRWQQTAELCAANEVLIDVLAAQDLSAADAATEVVGFSISLVYWQALVSSRRHNLLRYWLRECGLSIPEQRHLEQIDQQLLGMRQDAEPQINWGELSLRVFRERLFVLPLASIPKLVALAEPIAIDLECITCVDLPSGARLLFEHGGGGLNANLPDLNIRFRSGGERCRPVGRAHSQTLKRLLQEYQIPTWLRATLPLIYSGADLVAVADLWICEGFAVQNEGFAVRYQPNPAT